MEHEEEIMVLILDGSKISNVNTGWEQVHETFASLVCVAFVHLCVITNKFVVPEYL